MNTEVKYDLNSLNPEQLKPVLHTEGAVLVTAGAGSGKTRLLTHRIAHLVGDKNVPDYRILAITFTNKAADEMRTRLEKMIDGRGMWIMTFHAFCARILRRDIERLGYTSNFTIYSDNDKERVLKRLVTAREWDTDKYVKQTMNALGDMKNANLTLSEFAALNNYNPASKNISLLMGDYEQELKKSNALDFDDLLIKTLELLTTCPDILQKYQERFHYILVDEFQDTNETQYEITRLLGEGHGNVFIVGDEDQCIYGWRGANIRNLRKFIKDFNCAVYKLEQNYRSTRKILDAANRLISNNKTRIEKVLWSGKPDGARIEYFAARDEGEEAEYIASQISSLVRFSGYKYKDFAVLLRLNALTRSIEERLLAYNIPHVVFGGFKFFERKEVKDVVAYLRVLVNPYDTESLLRIINFPKRGIGAAMIAQLQNYCAVEGKTLYSVLANISENEDLTKAAVTKLRPFSDLLNDLSEAARTMPLEEIAHTVVGSAKIMSAYEDDTEENLNRKMNIGEFLSAVEEYATKNPGATLEQYLQSITLMADIDALDDNSDAVSIATVHSAKGLEFGTVFVAGMDEGIMPSSRAFDDVADMEEERRLMYVAITRAEERLYLTRAQSRFLYGKRSPMPESRFVAEALGVERAKRVDPLAAQPRTVIPTQEFVSRSSRTEPTRSCGVFEAGDKVRHNKFGEGLIISISGNGNNTYANIDFGALGVKTLALAFAPLEKI